MILSDEEKIILKNLPLKYKWIARDKNGDLNLYETKPTKSVGAGYWATDNYQDFNFYGHLFSEIKWENEGPTKILDIIDEAQIAGLDGI